MKAKALRVRELKEPLLMVQEDGVLIWHHRTEQIFDSDVHWVNIDPALRFTLRTLFSLDQEYSSLWGHGDVKRDKEIEIAPDPNDPNLILNIITRTCEPANQSVDDPDRQVAGGEG